MSVDKLIVLDKLIVRITGNKVIKGVYAQHEHKNKLNAHVLCRRRCDAAKKAVKLPKIQSCIRELSNKKYFDLLSNASSSST